MFDIQKAMDAMDGMRRDDAAKYGHMTIGRLIEELGRVSYDLLVVADNQREVCAVFSCYRGYYEDAALHYGKATTAGALKNAAQEELGATHGGYKGGDFTFDAKTLIWLAADYGDCSQTALMGLKIEGGKCVLATRQID